MITELQTFKIAVERIKQQETDIMVSKQKDYGPQNISDAGLLGVALRANDKIQRLLTLLRQNLEPSNESLLDTWLDLANYGTIGTMLLQGTWPGSAATISKKSTTRLVYLAGPIDMDDTTDKLQWRETVSMKLAKHNIATYSPAHAFHWAGDNTGAEKLIYINEEALRQSDALFLYLPSNTPTIGSICEYQQALNIKKPVFVCWSKPKIPIYLSMATAVKPTLEETLMELVNFGL